MILAQKNVSSLCIFTVRKNEGAEMQKKALLSDPTPI
jgi:hypothetical protein